MNITQTNINRINNTPHFSGRIITKGNELTAELEQAFKKNPYISELASGDYDIIAKFKAFIDTQKGSYHYGDTLCKVLVEAKKSEMTTFEKIKYFLGFRKKVDLSNNIMHSEETTLSIIKKQAENLKSLLKI